MGLILEFDQVTKTFRGFSLDSISFQLERGYIMDLIGPNGSGKTTLIRLIMGLMRPESGKIRLFGLDPRKDGGAVRQRIGFVYDRCPFHGELTIAAMTRLIAPVYTNWDWDAYHNYVAQFALPTKKKIKALSKGTKLKYALAVALAHRAELLILDEPTAGLDPVWRREFLQLLTRVIARGNCSILFASHLISDLERIADYITLLAGGKMLFSREKEALLDDYALIKGNRSLIKEPLAPYLIGTPREYQFGFEGLVTNRAKVAELVGEGAHLTTPGLEDIMYFYLGGQYHG